MYRSTYTIFLFYVHRGSQDFRVHHPSFVAAGEHGISRANNHWNPKLSPPSCVMAGGSQKRITTVHDRAALRVHPDGTRVTAKESRYATQDLRGNWTAVNAGGTGNVKKRKRSALPDDESEPQEEFDIETDEYQPSENQSSSTDSRAGEVESEGEGRKRKRQKKDPRAIKRAQFYQDFDFVLGGRNAAGAVSVSSDPLLPSSVGCIFRRILCPVNALAEQDLLKCIHHFAAKYYLDKSQLIDASRIARRRKKARVNDDTGSRSSSLSTVDSMSGEESDGSGMETALTHSTPLHPQKQKGRQGAELVKDMYKIFDGSALVALGEFPVLNATLLSNCRT